MHALVYWRSLANNYLSSENSANTYIDLYIHSCLSVLTSPHFSAPPYYCASCYLCSSILLIQRSTTGVIIPSISTVPLVPSKNKETTGTL